MLLQIIAIILLVDHTIFITYASSYDIFPINTIAIFVIAVNQLFVWCFIK